MRQSWSSVLNRTWFADDRRDKRFREDLDNVVARHLGRHQGRRGAAATPENVLGLGCCATATYVHDVGRNPSNAGYCAIAFALLGELLLCAEEGGILQRDIVARFDGHKDESAPIAEAVHRLRNALCHPAAVSPDHGEVAVQALLGFMEANYRDEMWLDDVRRNPGTIYLDKDRRVASFALRMVTRVGVHQARRWGISIPRGCSWAGGR